MPVPSRLEDAPPPVTADTGSGTQVSTLYPNFVLIAYCQTEMTAGERGFLAGSSQLQLINCAMNDIHGIFFKYAFLCYSTAGSLTIITSLDQRRLPWHGLND